MKTVAVLRGGASSEHEVSLKSGACALNHFPKEYFNPLDIFIDRQGVWHVRGVPAHPERALCSVDVVFNALHGEYGEDGTVQRLLDRLGVPYTGSGAFSSALAMNKMLTKEAVEKVGIQTPSSITLSVTPDLEEEIVQVFRSFSQPSVIKPVSSGSSVGVTLAHTFDDFKNGVKKAFQHSKQVLIEELIKGREATVGVVDALRDEKHYCLPVVEIIPKENCAFFDYEAKYSGESEERCPGNFSLQEVNLLQEAALKAHQVLGLRHYSRSDFIVTPQGIYFLETNTLPGLTEESLLPKSLQAVGVSMPEFLNHVVDLAQSGR